MSALAHGPHRPHAVAGARVSARARMRVAMGPGHHGPPEPA